MQPGDLIKIFCFFYSHWAVYVGNGWAIHKPKVGGCVEYVPVNELVGNRRMTCIRMSTRIGGPAAVVAWAKSQLGKCDYNLITNNCEHFAMEAATGRRESTQVRSSILGLLLVLVVGALSQQPGARRI